jgi:hypothetical protein
MKFFVVVFMLLFAALVPSHACPLKKNTLDGGGNRAVGSFMSSTCNYGTKKGAWSKDCLALFKNECKPEQLDKFASTVAEKHGGSCGGGGKGKGKTKSAKL